MPSSFVDVCRFNPAAGSTTDWTYSSAVTGYQSPTAAGAVNGAIYSYRAESNDLSQWEVGFGAYNSGTGVFARTTVLFNSSGGTSKINFSTVPQVAIVALAEDLASLVGTNNFTNATDATSSTAGGAFTIAGGLAVAKKLFVGAAAAISGALSITDTTPSTNSTTGALKVAGGAGIAGTAFASGGFRSDLASSVGSHIDASAQSQITIANGASGALTPVGYGSYFLFMCEQSNFGDGAVFLACAQNTPVFVAGNSAFVVSSTPAAGKIGIYTSGGQYLAKNNLGASITLKVLVLQSG